MSKIVVLGVGVGSSILGFGLFLYMRKVKKRLRQKILQGK